MITPPLIPTLFPYTTLFRSAKFANLNGYRKPVFLRNEEKGKADGFLLTDDLAPNTNGCILLGFDELTPAEFSAEAEDRKSTRLNSSHVAISYAVFCLKKKNS